MPESSLHEAHSSAMRALVASGAAAYAGNAWAAMIEAHAAAEPPPPFARAGTSVWRCAPKERAEMTRHDDDELRSRETMPPGDDNVPAQTEDPDDEAGTEAVGAGAGALGGAAVGGAVAGPPGAVVGGVAGAVAGGAAGEAAEGDEEAGSATGGGAGTVAGAAVGGAVAGPPGAAVGGAVGAGGGAAVGDKAEEGTDEEEDRR
jgi:hypothetical protein